MSWSNVDTYTRNATISQKKIKKIANYGYQDVLDTGIHTNPMPCVGFGKWTGVDTNVP